MLGCRIPTKLMAQVELFYRFFRNCLSMLLTGKMMFCLIFYLPKHQIIGCSTSLRQFKDEVRYYKKKQKQYNYDYCWLQVRQYFKSFYSCQNQDQIQISLEIEAPKSLKWFQNYQVAQDRTLNQNIIYSMMSNQWKPNDDVTAIINQPGLNAQQINDKFNQIRENIRVRHVNHNLSSSQYKNALNAMLRMADRSNEMDKTKLEQADVQKIRLTTYQQDEVYCKILIKEVPWLKYEPHPSIGLRKSLEPFITKASKIIYQMRQKINQLESQATYSKQKIVQLKVVQDDHHTRSQFIKSYRQLQQKYNQLRQQNTTLKDRIHVLQN